MPLLIKKASERVIEIRLYDTIGETWWGGISARQLTDEVASYGKLDKIILRINSLGGDVFDSVAIYNYLRAHEATVEVFIDGVAASGASVVALAGDTVNMGINALFMIHNAWSIVMGTADKMRKAAEDLDKCNDAILMTYAARCKKPKDEIRYWMKEETWFTAEEALEVGFVDHVTELVKVASARFQDTTLFPYKNMPDRVLDVRFAGESPSPKEISLSRDVKLTARALDQGLVYGVVYEPNMVDTHGDYATEEDIEKAAHGFLPNAVLNLEHQDDVEDVQVVESYIAPCNFRQGDQLIAKGSWVLVTKILNEDLKKAIESGEVNAYSLEGTASKL